MNKIVYCNHCGAENSEHAKFCSECGKKIERVQVKGKRKSGTAADSAAKSNQNKSISTSNVLLYVYGLLIIGIVYLFAIGLFDSIEPDSSAAGQGNVSSDPHSGINMNSFQKISDLEQRVAANPSDHTSILELAHLLNDSGLYEKAIQRYKEYLATHPDNTDVLVDMGVCYFSLADYKNATTAMQKAISINPKHQIGHFNLGIVSFAQNKTAEAINWWEKAIALNPGTDIAAKAKELIDQNK
ncbi:MAG: tetratricopeptide repeat protein [Melioribacteraceae bacterium]|nr:tetratricopeptide repeat protein [Melioribacteraceae bacterium]